MEAPFSPSPALNALITVWIAVMGLSIGSFLNVVIGRLPEDEDFDAPDPGDSWWEGWKLSFRISGRALKRLAWPPSRCPKCGHQLRWYENIPVVSWLALRGKCSACKAPISPRYILVELLTGTLFVVLALRFPFDWSLVSALVFITLLIPLVFIDAEHWILPFELTLPGIAVALLLAIPQDTFSNAALGAAVGFLAFRFMEVVGWFGTSTRITKLDGTRVRVGREALGAGDKYLLAMIGAALGPRALMGVITLSAFHGAAVGIIRMKLTGRAGPGEAPEDEKEEPPPAEPPPPAVEGAEPPPPTPPVDELKEAAEEGLYPFTPSFLAPGLPWWKRVVLVPVTVLFQDIPDNPPPDEETGEVPDWEPQANNLPFGPWLGLAAVEVMLFGQLIIEKAAHTPFSLVAQLAFGQ